MNGDDKAQNKLAKLKFQNVNGDLTIFLNQIKIKDFDKWSKMETDMDMVVAIKDRELEPNNLKSAMQKALLARLNVERNK